LILSIGRVAREATKAAQHKALIKINNTQVYCNQCLRNRSTFFHSKSQKDQSNLNNSKFTHVHDNWFQDVDSTAFEKAIQSFFFHDLSIGLQNPFVASLLPFLQSSFVDFTHGNKFERVCQKSSAASCESCNQRFFSQRQIICSILL
jgi:hypothetical protein